MIKIEQNQNFTKFFNVFAFGKLVDQVSTHAKALKVANELACEHKQSHFLLVDSEEFVPTSKS